ncbi:unnamed protein product [Spirodela intermedia]|uniref:DUF7804 domain-containing protein n=1 Tax=Spirodela intermedia TaxID=51605 RepID=A0A7I8J161_SPIIN|nr:unnamed protein product [Spirodela intermedia]CAA6663702.1 unnamed protein product [Spirodela intermedia]
MRAVKSHPGGGFFSGNNGDERQLLAGGGAAARGDPVPAEKLDEWVHESVLEIVRNIGEAPFLVHVFANSGGSSALRLQRDAADAQSWPRIQKRWNTGAGVSSRRRGGARRLLRRGRHRRLLFFLEDVGPARAGAGRRLRRLLHPQHLPRPLPVRILHALLLARAKCFGETAAAQLRNSWLLGANRLQPQ